MFIRAGDGPMIQKRIIFVSLACCIFEQHEWMRFKKKRSLRHMSNTDIVKTGLRAWESNDAQTLTALVADDFVLSGPVPQPLGKQEFLGLMQVLHTAMPDFAFNVSSFEEEGDKVIARSHIT